MSWSMASAAPAWIVCVALLAGMSGCGSPYRGISRDAEFASATTAARLAFAQGQVERATQLYERALARARGMDNPEGISDAAYNLAMCLTEMRQYARARVQLAEAKAEALRAGSGIIDVLLVEAAVARLQGSPNEARALADEVLRRKPAPKDAQRLQVHLLRSEIACDAGDAVAAAAELARVSNATGYSLPLQARLAQVRGRIDLLERNWTAAARGFDREAGLLRQARRYRSMSEALAAAARAYQAAGADGPAADLYYRAARSSFGLGDAAESRNLIAAAISAARRAGAADLERLAVSLSSEIDGVVRGK